MSTTKRISKYCGNCGDEFQVLVFAKDRVKNCGKCFIPKAKKTTICLSCKKEFGIYDYLIKRGKGKYCSRKCVEASYLPKVDKVCKQCGKQYQVKPSIQNTNKYCSRICKQLSERSQFYGQIRGERVKRYCKKCKKEFYPLLSAIKKGIGKYCSKLCTPKWMKKGKKLSPSHRQNVLNAIQKRFINLEPTSIEKAVYDYLVCKEIIFERQKQINGKFFVDAYIPNLNLVIEADGKYWHSRPDGIKRDKAKNAYLAKCGYKILRLTEEEINNGKFKRKLKGGGV